MQKRCRPAERAKQAQSHQLITDKPRTKALLKLLLKRSSQLMTDKPRAKALLKPLSTKYTGLSQCLKGSKSVLLWKCQLCWKDAFRQKCKIAWVLGSGGFFNKWIIHMVIAHDAMLTNDEWCTKLLMNDCIVFVCEFIELDSCLVGPRRYPEQWICFPSDYWSNGHSWPNDPLQRRGLDRPIFNPRRCRRLIDWLKTVQDKSENLHDMHIVILLCKKWPHSVWGKESSNRICECEFQRRISLRAISLWANPRAMRPAKTPLRLRCEHLKAERTLCDRVEICVASYYGSGGGKRRFHDS